MPGLIFFMGIVVAPCSHVVWFLLWLSGFECWDRVRVDRRLLALHPHNLAPADESLGQGDLPSAMLALEVPPAALEAAALKR